MDSDFFKAKRPWSRYKDQLLEKYLPSYLEKVKVIGKPIVVVDAFAGRGVFEDGERGSPLIIADAVLGSRERTSATARFIEADPENFRILTGVIAGREDYCEASYGTFDSQLDMIDRLARTSTLFLYLDPYSVMGLPFHRLEKIYRHLSRSNSVEVLLNFNTPILARCCLAALKRFKDIPSEDAFEASEDDLKSSPEKESLNAIAGGDYWESICSESNLTFVEKIEAILKEYSGLMHKYFPYVFTFDVQEKLRHSVPKYTMIYATRSPRGVELMNNVMRETRKAFVASEVPKGRLFDLTPEEEIVTPEDLDLAILTAMAKLGESVLRPALRFRVIRDGMFGRQTRSEIDRGIEGLLKDGRLVSKTGRSRINDTVPLSRPNKVT